MSKTIQEVIEIIMKHASERSVKDTVDTLKSGDPSWEVTGIVTTFTATVDVIKQASKLGANLIITHEPTFYNHHDRTDWLKDDPVYICKQKLIDDYKIAIWRFHDCWHLHKPDGIMLGVVKELQWDLYADPCSENIYVIPSVTLSDLVSHLKSRLSIPYIRAVGNPDMYCRRVGLLAGAIGGDAQMNFILKEDFDVIICGETAEWQTCEFFRDAVAFGQNKALVILGHANSEEAGMKYLADWLSPKIPDITISFVPAGDPIKLL